MPGDGSNYLNARDLLGVCSTKSVNDTAEMAIAYALLALIDELRDEYNDSHRSGL